MTVAVILALLGQFWAYDALAAGLTGLWGCNPSPTCEQFSASSRVSFATFIFFTAAAGIGHFNQAWDVKFLVYAVLVATCVFLPNEAIEAYVWVARVFAFVFLVLQQIVIIDSAYLINEVLLEWHRLDTESNKWIALLISLITICFTASFVWIALLFVFFWSPECGAAKAFICIALASVLGMTTLQLVVDYESSAVARQPLLVSSVVSLYVIYLVFIALSTNPSEECNPLYTDSSKTAAIVFGLVLAFLSTVSTAAFSSSSMSNLAVVSLSSTRQLPANHLEDVLTGAPTVVVGSATSPPEQPPMTTAGSSTSGKVATFNLAMAIISCYWCMVLTNWGDASEGRSGSNPTAGKVSMWMNASASWICSALYAWTIVAPKLLPDRDFS